MKVAYVTDLSLKQSGGGSYAVNWHAFMELERRFTAHYCGPVRVNVPFVENYLSKFRRKILGRPGRFAYFSETTLSRNASAVEEILPPEMDAIVFRSAARWCRCRPRVPYFIYLDAVFRTFFQNTFSSSDFDARDLARIFTEEAAFLEGAEAVFFESKWGMDRAIDSYGLRGSHYIASGRGGVIDPPADDVWQPATSRLLSIAMNFRQKGGDIVLEAFRKLKPRYPLLRWDIVGGEPEGDWRSVHGITYHGRLSPDNDLERSQLETLLANAFLLVHPTREDINPLVPTEAAYFGCPSISMNMFAIPELVIDGETGLLLESPATPQSVAAAIERLLTDKNLYLSMRRKARLLALQHHSWRAIGSAICDRIQGSIKHPRAEPNPAG